MVLVLLRLFRFLAVAAAALALGHGGPFGASAETARVAVATNFKATAERLAAEFEAATEHQVVISSGSTGHLYAQIQHGGPYDIFLAADDARPRRLVATAKAPADRMMTYALGQLVLWSREDLTPGSIPDRLAAGEVRRIAMANPELAPYGRAAAEALVAIVDGSDTEPRVAYAENVGQAFSFVATGNAELGFVALAQLKTGRFAGTGSYWIVPSDLYSPIRQSGVLLDRGADNPAAIAFYDYLSSARGREIIAASGYELP